MHKPDHKTDDFLKKIDLLISRGVIKNHAEVVKDLNWNKSVMSSVKNGTLPVPQHIYNKFKETYIEQLENLTKKPERVENNNEYKDKYITALEDQVAILKQQLTDLQKKLEFSSNNLMENAKVNQVYLKTIYLAFQQHRAKTEKVPLQKIADDMDKELAVLGERV